MRRRNLPGRRHCESGALGVGSHGDPRRNLAILIPDGTCATCLEPVGSPLHHELCEVTSGERRPRARAHGTDSGYQGHLKNGTPPCQPCRDARAATGRRQRARRAA